MFDWIRKWFSPPTKTQTRDAGKQTATPTEFILDDAAGSFDVRKNSSPLAPGHSRCPKCQHVFDRIGNTIEPADTKEMSTGAQVFLPEIMKLLGSAGYSMPHLRCPKCGTTWMEQVQSEEGLDKTSPAARRQEERKEASPAPARSPASGDTAANLSYGGYDTPSITDSVRTLLIDNYHISRRDAASAIRTGGLAEAIKSVVPYLKSQYAWERDAAQAALQYLRGSLSDDEAASVVIETDPREVKYLCGTSETCCKKVTVVPISPFSGFRCPTCSPSGIMGFNVASTLWNDRMEALAQSELDTESEKVARRLVTLQQQQNAIEAIKAIGRELGKRGGFFRMLAVCHRVGVLAGSYRRIEYLWDGICGWQG